MQPSSRVGLDSDSGFETRFERLIRQGQAVPVFIQGVYPFAGRGVFEAGPIDDRLSFVVPPGSAAHVLYFRAGNMADSLIYCTLAANGAPIRYFPIGPQGDVHISLAITEPHLQGTRLEVGLAAPRGLSGTLVLDVGIVVVTTPAGAP